MADETPAHNFQISVPESMTGGVWANFAAVSHSPYEFTIDFVRLDFAHGTSTTMPGQVVARVNLSPLMVSQLLDALDQNWQKYAAHALPGLDDAGLDPGSDPGFGDGFDDGGLGETDR
ncbi:MAG: DUF3467 domain-containing protein [Nocardioidaceae bacterium]